MAFLLLLCTLSFRKDYILSKRATFEVKLKKCLSLNETDPLFEVYTCAHLCERQLQFLPKLVKEELFCQHENLRKYSDKVGIQKSKLNNMKMPSRILICLS